MSNNDIKFDFQYLLQNLDKVQKAADFLNSSAFSKLVDQVLEQDVSDEDLYEEIADHYDTLLSILNIRKFESIDFPDKDYPRLVVIDGISYDLDDSAYCEDEKYHDEASGALCSIDCLAADCGDKPAMYKAVGEILIARHKTKD